MTSSLSRHQAVLLGLSVVLAVTLSVSGLFAVGSRQWLWGDTFEVRAGFRQVRGVEAGTRVRVQGVDAGQVVAVEPPATPGGEVLVRLRVDGRLRHLVRADARARIVPEGMVGGKVMEIEPGSGSTPPVADGGFLATEPSVDLADAARELREEVGSTLKEVRDGVHQAGQTLKEVRNGEGVMGKELLQALREVNMTVQQVRDGEGVVGSELQQSLQQFRRTLSSIKQDVDAVQQLPLVGSYVKDPLKSLVRPDCERYQQWFTETDLFVPGQAVLTESGRARLMGLGPWLSNVQAKGAEVVVAAYADPAADTDLARIVTQKQSEAVCDFLKAHHSIHKVGWFSRRSVTPVGCGADPRAPGDKLPRPRVEVLVFVPST